MPTKQELKDSACAAIDPRKDEIIALPHDTLKHPATANPDSRTSALVTEWC